LNRGWEEPDLRAAETRLTDAVRRDSTFALGYAKLAQTHASLYWWRYDHTPDRLAQAQSAADRAARLDPDLPEAHHALGLLHYWGHFDYDRALAEFAIARRGRPNDATITLVTGAAERRRGNFQQALSEMDRARTLDPRFGVPAVDYAYTLMLMGRYGEAEPAWDRAIAIGPDQRAPYELRSLMYLKATGDIAKARASLMEGLQRVALGRSDLTLRLGWLDELDGDHAAALSRLGSAEAEAINSHEEFIPRADLLAQVHAALGHTAAARAYYDSAEAVVRNKLVESPDAANLRSALGLVLAGLGRRDESLREARRAVELLPITKDAVDGPLRVRDLARTLVMVGDLDGALDQLEVLFRLPAANPLSPSLLRLDPVWAPLQGRPRFERLLAAK
ncbi:MAG: tetratricopeptide repeat protein, partial [Gemmatimonadales bacterium]